jgi:hypothetical protein
VHQAEVTEARRAHLNTFTKFTPRKDHRGVDLISDTLPFSRLWYGEAAAIGCAKFYGRSYYAVIHIYDDAGNVIETHEPAGEFKEW